MRIGRTLPPAAAPIGWRSLFNGLASLFKGEVEIKRFENELKDYFDKKHCFLVSSGKAALTLILLALKEQYPDRNEVIIPAYTCYSVPSAIVRAGLKVKLCDLAENSFDFDYNLLTPMLGSDKLLAVLPTHLFGLPADIKRLKEMIDEPAVTVIEDAAQAMGAKWQDEKLGTIGHVGFFSLGRGKAFSTVEGGIILTDNDDLALFIEKQMIILSEYAKFETFKLVVYVAALNILLHPYLFWIPKKLPFLKLGKTNFNPDFEIKKMTGLQAGLAINWIGKLISYKHIREDKTKEWLSSLDAVYCPFLRKNDPHLPGLIRFPILIDDDKVRSELLEYSEQQGLGAAVVYPETICNMSECSRWFKGQDFPVAKMVAQRVLTLPVHVFVRPIDVRLLSEFLTLTSSHRKKS